MESADAGGGENTQGLRSFVAEGAPQDDNVFFIGKMCLTCIGIGDCKLYGQRRKAAATEHRLKAVLLDGDLEGGGGLAVLVGGV
jgi:hypothetical protein